MATHELLGLHHHAAQLVVGEMVRADEARNLPHRLEFGFRVNQVFRVDLHSHATETTTNGHTLVKAKRRHTDHWRAKSQSLVRTIKKSKFGRELCFLDHSKASLFHWDHNWMAFT